MLSGIDRGPVSRRTAQAGPICPASGRTSRILRSGGRPMICLVAAPERDLTSGDAYAKGLKRRGVYATNGAVLSVIARSSPEAPVQTCSLRAGRAVRGLLGYPRSRRTQPSGRPQGAHQQHCRTGHAAPGRRGPLDINTAISTKGTTAGDDLAVVAGVVARRLASGLKPRGSSPPRNCRATRGRCGAARLRPAARVGHRPRTCRIGPREAGACCRGLAFTWSSASASSTRRSSRAFPASSSRARFT